MDGLDRDDKEKLEQARQLQRTKESEKESWAVKATKAILNDGPNQAETPTRVDKSLKALFNEGAFTATSGNVPGYYVPSSSEGYPPELRRDTRACSPRMR